MKTKINKLITFQICTDFNAWDELCDDLKKKLFDIISKYTSTPIDEREEEKKFYLKHRYFKCWDDSHLCNNLPSKRLKT